MLQLPLVAVVCAAQQQRDVFALGDEMAVTATFLDTDGDPTDPTAISAIVTAPDGTEATYSTSSHPALWARVELGVWRFRSTEITTALGLWKLRVRATAGLVTSASAQYLVEPE